MTLTQQILWGSLYLGVCLILQMVFMALGATYLNKLSGRLSAVPKVVHNSSLLLIALVLIVLSHTAQTWLWACVFVINDVLADWNSAIYFSLVTYTALGYGDIVLGPGLRIFAAFASVTGLLAFGISTAFLVALMGRLFSARLN
ncbi:MAG: hypothetical protein ACI8R4_001535 [Paracoccaceae bacterium]|jgi:hypothetical protein